ncbi:MAG TPA: RnfABCDGE type electron transport complex subunit G [Mariprofundaceae bacterium]|nr:RnfABCDGE type electron transport complex subunit G [Mariprofundaceae bacterium]
MKVTREQWLMVLALVLVATICTVLLGMVDEVTQGPITQAEQDTLYAALVEVLPPHQNDPIHDVLHISDADTGPVTLYLARDGQGKVNGAAFEVVAPDGYSGNIFILLGVDRDGQVHAIRVTNHHETPGLGDGIVKNHRWVDSFAGRGLVGTRWAVKKDGGDFDQFTGATISPRAVVNAVRRGLEFYQRHQDQVAAADRVAAAPGGV